LRISRTTQNISTRGWFVKGSGNNCTDYTVGQRGGEEGREEEKKEKFPNPLKMALKSVPYKKVLAELSRNQDGALGKPPTTIDNPPSSHDITK